MPIDVVLAVHVHCPCSIPSILLTGSLRFTKCACIVYQCDSAKHVVTVSHFVTAVLCNIDLNPNPKSIEVAKQAMDGNQLGRQMLDLLIQVMWASGQR